METIVPLTDSTHRKETGKALRKRAENGWYPDSVKMDCIKLWLITGNLRAVSAAQNIPYKTLQVWRYSDWWAQLSEEIRTEGHIQLSNKLKNIAAKALDVTLDRLENGDYVLNQKTGEMQRKPVVMRDAHRVAESLIDRGLKISDKPVEELNNQKVQDRLASLATAFEAFAKKTRKIEVIDAEDSGTPYPAIEGTWREAPEGPGIRSAEQDGAHEGDGADLEGESTERHDSRGESQGSAG